MANSCISCGWPISNDYTWQASYRALHKTPGGTQLSDVFLTKYDWSRDYNYSKEKTRTKKFGIWYAMANRSPAEAFLFHDCCWALLMKQFVDEEVNFDRLFGVRANMGIRHTSVIDRYTSEGPWYPLERPIVRRIGDATKQLSKIRGRKKAFISNTAFGTDDCFSLLAMEMRLEIASYLSTIDFFSLRLASRAMAPLFDMQVFWKTRFRTNGDRGFLASLVDGSRGRKKKNWRSVYRCSARIEHRYLHFWALRQQWRNNQWLTDRYYTVAGFDNQAGSQFNLFGEPWEGVSADTTSSVGKLWNWLNGSKPDGNQTVVLQNTITDLVVFISNEGTITYITGFDLISSDPATRNITFGYRLPGSQVTINLHDRRLRGFTIITGDGGIRAIRPIFNDNNDTASWIGQAEGVDVCTTTPVILNNDIKAISGRLDASHLYHQQVYSQILTMS